jgi:hypothetical protein
LRVPGASVENNIVERLLKTPILNRKNSYFYKTLLGAYIKDMVMSLVQTAKEAEINPREYLLALHQNKDLVKISPEKWFPWNFQQNF